MSNPCSSPESKQQNQCPGCAAEKLKKDGGSADKKESECPSKTKKEPECPPKPKERECPGKSKEPETEKKAPVEEEYVSQLNFSYEVIKEIADWLLKSTEIKPKIAIICGSGLSNLGDGFLDSKEFEYKDIPKFPTSTVPGHAGKLVFGYLNCIPVVAMKGRFHHYEGYSLQKCSMPVRVMKLLGVEYLITTNAAGGINPNFKVGHVMLIRDHINIMGFAGNSPLRGPNEEKFGPRFPPLNKAYDPDLITKAKEIGKNIGMEKEMHEGVYACLGGPTYETVAELRALRCLGVDAVGMSTVNEVVTARHCGLTVFAFSLITNECIMEYDSDKKANHEEVLAAGKAAAKKLAELVGCLVKAVGKKYKIN